jgi:hexosaminidase
LTRVIDAVYPESETAREFSGLVQQFEQSGYKDQATEAQIRSWLTLWRNNDATLQRLLKQSALLQDNAPVSQNLAMVAAAGLQALDYLDRGQAEPELWKTQQLAVIDQAKKPVAGLLLMVVAPVQQLVEASGTAHN